MDFIMKRNIWFWILVSLVIINVVALITIIFSNKNPIQVNNPPSTENMEFRGMNYFLRHELNLSREQFEELRMMRQVSLNETSQIWLEIHGKREAMLEEIIKNEPDEAKIENLAKEMGDLHEKLKLQTFNHFLQIKNVCTPDQQKKLNRFLKEIKERNPPHHHRKRMRGREFRRHLEN